jgi:hypothetical protein
LDKDGGPLFDLEGRNKIKKGNAKLKPIQSIVNNYKVDVQRWASSKSAK